jgi:hypothetical protein
MGLHPFERQGFWKIAKNVFVEKHGFFSKRLMPGLPTQ